MLLFISTLHLQWSYDEYGAVISQVELDDPGFIQEYLNIAESVCPHCPFLPGVVEYFLMPVFVVPIRWTYAIGISPVLGLARWLPVDWPELKPLLLLPNILFSSLGLWFVIRAVAALGVGRGAQLTFLALVFASQPLVWWINSFTSYANHLICFGLLCHASLIETNRSHTSVLGRAALMRVAAPLLNYQYTPILALIGLLDMARDPKKFFTHLRWRSWILPTLICLANLIFLIARARVSGKHLSPTTAALSESQVLLYSFPNQSTDVIQALKIIVDRYTDILIFFYAPDSGHFTDVSVTTVAFALCLSIVLTIVAWQRLDRQLFIFLISMIMGTVLLHLIGIMPMSPTRHQLVLITPLCLIGAVTIEKLLPTGISNRAFPLVAIFGVFLALGYQTTQYFQVIKGIPIQVFHSALEEIGVERLVLAPCDLEPMLYPELRKRYRPIYRCGPRVVNQLPSDVQVIAVWSSFHPLTENDAKNIVADYSSDIWEFRSMPLLNAYPYQKDVLFIGHRVERSSFIR